MKTPKVMVVAGLGIGCENEAARAYRMAGADAEIVHINSVLSGKTDMMRFDVVNFSGGFLQGDMLGSALAMANQLEHVPVKTAGGEKKFMEIMQEEFIPKGGIVYGQCNGFQLMVKLGMLPGWDGCYTNQVVSLTHNEPRRTYDQTWALHKVNGSSPCIAFKGIEYIVMPCRHGEGRLTFGEEFGSVSADEAAKNRERVNRENVLLWYADPATGKPTMQYPENQNRSVDSIAGISDPTGRVFGHMAHPEAATLAAHYPDWQKKKDRMIRQGIFDFDRIYEGDGLRVFRNTVDWVRKNAA